VDIRRVPGPDESTPAASANWLGQIVTHFGYAEVLWARAVLAGETMDMSWRSTCSTFPTHGPAQT
jgi:hypothetical protein